MEQPQIDIESLKEEALKAKIKEMISNFYQLEIDLDKLVNFLYLEVIKPQLEREKFMQVTPLGRGKVGK